MPIFHTVYNLYSTGLVDENLTRSLFWIIYQKIGLGTFVLVSGVSFVLSTQHGLNWSKLTKRIVKLAVIACSISFATWLFMSDKFVRFGVIHFFTVALILAPAFRAWRYWLLIPGTVIIGVYLYFGHGGVLHSYWWYPSGLMTNRPASIDYIPLAPWFGVFLVGMACGFLLEGKHMRSEPTRWMMPIIWLGKHSLPFYLIHQVVIFGFLSGIALLI